MDFSTRARSTAIAVAGVLTAALLTTASPTEASAAGGSASIAGSVVTESGSSAVGTYVTLYEEKSWGWGYVETITTGPSGGYSFADLEAGAYTLSFTPADGANLLPEWWNDQPSEGAATAIDLDVGQTATGYLTELVPGATISGTLTAPLLKDGPSSLAVCAESATYTRCTFDVADGGAFDVVGLPAGDYKVAFGGQGGCGEYSVGSESLWSCRRETYWNSSPGPASASVVSLADREARTGVNQNFDIAAGKSIYPKITGTATVGKKLTAASGSWEPGTEVRHSWEANGEPIAGATGSTLTLSAAQLGKKITARVFGLIRPPANSGGYGTWESTGWTMADKVTPATLTTTTPTIAGTVAVGSKLTAKVGTWTPTATLTYQWLANGKAISKATKATLTLSSSLKGKKISVKVAGKKAGYTTASKTSKATAKVAVAKTPVISGVAKVGSKLTAKPGSWTTGSTFTYSWYANGRAIAKATKSTYTPTASLRGKKITVKVTGKRAGYATVSKISKATAAVR